MPGLCCAVVHSPVAFPWVLQGGTGLGATLPKGLGRVSASLWARVVPFITQPEVPFIWLLMRRGRAERQSRRSRVLTAELSLASEKRPWPALAPRHPSVKGPGASGASGLGEGDRSKCVPSPGSESEPCPPLFERGARFLVQERCPW